MMATGVVMEAIREGETYRAVAPPESGADSDLERRYQELLTRVLEEASRLFTQVVPLDDLDAWTGDFQRYRERLRELHVLGEQLRPSTLRDREETLAGRALTAEVAEVFSV